MRRHQQTPSSAQPPAPIPPVYPPSYQHTAAAIQSLPIPAPQVGRGWRLWSSIRDRPSWQWWAAGGVASVVSIWGIYRWRSAVNERQQRRRANHTRGITQADLAFSTIGSNGSAAHAAGDVRTDLSDSELDELSDGKSDEGTNRSDIDAETDIITAIPSSSSSNEMKDNSHNNNNQSPHARRDNDNDSKRYGHHYDDSGAISDHGARSDASTGRRSQRHITTAANDDNNGATSTNGQRTPSAASSSSSSSSAFHFGMSSTRHQSNPRESIAQQSQSGSVTAATITPIANASAPSFVPTADAPSSSSSSPSSVASSHAMTTLLPVIQNQAQRTDALIVNVDHVLGRTSKLVHLLELGLVLVCIALLLLDMRMLMPLLGVACFFLPELRAAVRSSSLSRPSLSSSSSSAGLRSGGLFRGRRPPALPVPPSGNNTPADNVTPLSSPSVLVRPNPLIVPATPSISQGNHQSSSSSASNGAPAVGSVFTPSSLLNDGTGPIVTPNATAIATGGQQDASTPIASLNDNNDSNGVILITDKPSPALPSVDATSVPPPLTTSGGGNTSGPSAPNTPGSRRASTSSTNTQPRSVLRGGSNNATTSNSIITSSSSSSLGSRRGRNMVDSSDERDESASESSRKTPLPVRRRRTTAIGNARRGDLGPSRQPSRHEQKEKKSSTGGAAATTVDAVPAPAKQAANGGNDGFMSSLSGWWYGGAKKKDGATPPSSTASTPIPPSASSSSVPPANGVDAKSGSNHSSPSSSMVTPKASRSRRHKSSKSSKRTAIDTSASQAEEDDEKHFFDPDPEMTAMAEESTVAYTHRFPWEVVIQHFWNKEKPEETDESLRYWDRGRANGDLNDDEALARAIDVFYVQSQQWRSRSSSYLYTTRTMKVRNSVPLYLRKVIPAGGPYLAFHERSRLDNQSRVFRLEAINVDFKEMLITRDIREYRVHPNNPDHTIFIQRCFITADKTPSLFRDAIIKWTTKSFRLQAEANCNKFDERLQRWAAQPQINGGHSNGNIVDGNHGDDATAASDSSASPARL